MNLLQNKTVRCVVIALLFVPAAVSVVRGVQNAYTFSQDFQWDSARALMEGIDPYSESLSPSGILETGQLGDYYARFESIDAKQKMEANQFPSLLMLLMPWALLAPDAARVLWIISNLVFTAAIIILLRVTFLKELGRFEFCVMSLLMIAGTPYRNQLGVGQHTLFAFCFFLLAVWLAERDKLGIGTIFALFVCYFKYTLTAPLLLYFVYKKKYKEIIGSVLLHIVLTVFAAIRLGKPIIYMIMAPLKVASVLSSEGGIDLGALLNGTSASFIVAGIIAICLFVLTLKVPKGCDNLVFAVALLWSLILTYHRTYDFFVLAAVVTIFVSCDKMPQLEGGLRQIYLIGYGVLVLSVFFVLRIFSESLPSRIAVGIIYYAFTIAVSWLLIKEIYNDKRRKTQQVD